VIGFIKERRSINPERVEYALPRVKPGVSNKDSTNPEGVELTEYIL
jgi:hypothetical protein